MKAVRFSNPGGPENLRIEDVPIPDLKDGEVLLKIHATAVNRADIIQRQGYYPPPPGVTDILGLEAAGLVHSVGPNCGGKWKIGDEALALISGGSYAEYVAVREGHLFRKPINLSMCEGAGIPEAWLTAYQLLSLVANVQRNESVLIHAGASGVGTAAIQLVKTLYSGTVFATAGSDSKVEFLRNLGAQHVFNYKNGSFSDWVLKETNGRGVDIILDCVGGSYWMQNSDCIAMDGRWVMYGTMGGKDVNGDLLGRILRKRIRLQGTTLRTRTDEYKTKLINSFETEAIPHFETGDLFPVIDKMFRLDQVADSHRYVEQNLNIGKVVLTVESSETDLD